MKLYSLAVAVAPQSSLQNGILHFVFRLSQSLENCKVLLLIIRKQGYFFLDEPPSRVILASGMKNIMQ